MTCSALRPLKWCVTNAACPHLHQVQWTWGPGHFPVSPPPHLSFCAAGRIFLQFLKWSFDLPLKQKSLKVQKHVFICFNWSPFRTPLQWVQGRKESGFPELPNNPPQHPPTKTRDKIIPLTSGRFPRIELAKLGLRPPPPIWRGRPSPRQKWVTPPDPDPGSERRIPVPKSEPHLDGPCCMQVGGWVGWRTTTTPGLRLCAEAPPRRRPCVLYVVTDQPRGTLATPAHRGAPRKVSIPSVSTCPRGLSLGVFDLHCELSGVFRAWITRPPHRTVDV